MQQILPQSATLTIAAAPTPAAPLPTSVYNPGTGSAPPVLMIQAQLILDIIAWSATAACVAGILITAALMAISHHRGGGSEHFASLGKVLTACVLVATASAIVGWLA